MGLLPPAASGPKRTLDQIQRFVEKLQNISKNVLPATVVASPTDVPGVKIPVGTRPRTEAWLRRWLRPGAAFKRALSTRLQRATRRVGTQYPPSRATEAPAVGLFFFPVPRSSDENEMRKGFTVSERVAIAEAVAERLGRRHGSNQFKERGGGNFSTSSDDAGKTRDLAAAKAGAHGEP